MPDTGGANVPALNDLLSSWSIALGDQVYEGEYTLGDHVGYFASGTTIVRFPSSGVVVTLPLKDQGKENKLCVPYTTSYILEKTVIGI